MALAGMKAPPRHFRSRVICERDARVHFDEGLILCLLEIKSPLDRVFSFSNVTFQNKSQTHTSASALGDASLAHLVDE